MKNYFLLLSILVSCILNAQPFMVQDVNLITNAPFPPLASNYFNANSAEVFRGYNKNAWYNNWYYYAFNDGVHGNELWKTDGDTCMLVKNTHTGSFTMGNGQQNPYGINPDVLQVFNGMLYFRGEDTTNATYGLDTKLWMYDGMDVSMVHDFEYHTNLKSNLLIHNNLLYFILNDSLIAYDGNAYTALAMPSNFDLGSSHQFYLKSYQNEIYFIGGDLNDNSTAETHFKYFWKYDGTSIIKIQNNIPIQNMVGGMPVFDNNYIGEYNNQLVVVAYDTIHGQELKTFDGLNLALISDLYPGDSRGVSSDFISFQGKLLFLGNNGVHGTDLWEYDGVNINMVHNFNANDTLINLRGSFEIFNDKLYFAAIDSSLSNNIELFQYDGSQVQMVRSLFSGSDYFYNPSTLKKAGPYLYFTALDSAQGIELWRLEDCEIQNTATTNEVSCGPYWNGNEWLHDWIAIDTLMNVCNGDSILTTHYAYHPINTTVSQNGFTLTVADSSYNYQWITCDNGNAIPGAVSPSYSPTENGNYAVIFTDLISGCKDTSTCQTIVGLSVENWMKENFQLYPNPIIDQRFILSGKEVRNVSQINVYNALGQAIPFLWNKESPNSFEIELLASQKGIYYLRLLMDKEVFTFKIQQ
ncbi:hypothetical protein DNU06_04095 [Putridiphycobacter roseus]|uniref:Secretion system C-terminal sorting domain-containing protein n=1 Tax=Putridiphycobacter roseus TaxID=2219161 RepID=A0A2W1NT01_9FLAO|nr:T9SS type A sorting domain-containing protein [Putridiphycobacter roseus]PZE17808.1 hypothetical protein DNU06_04095 [Putridiphycobacter roseus]